MTGAKKLSEPGQVTVSLPKQHYDYLTYLAWDGRLGNTETAVAAHILIQELARDWQALVKAVLKAELKRRDLSYADLADKLAAIGVKTNRRNINNQIGRGTFSATFFFQCMKAIGCKTIHLEDE